MSETDSNVVPFARPARPQEATPPAADGAPAGRLMDPADVEDESGPAARELYRHMLRQGFGLAVYHQNYEAPAANEAARRRPKT
jgi:hypothetical protein